MPMPAQLGLFMHCVLLMSRCIPQSDCADAAAANRWKSSLTGRYRSCVNIVGVQPSELSLPVQRSVNVRRFSAKLFEIHTAVVRAQPPLKNWSVHLPSLLPSSLSHSSPFSFIRCLSSTFPAFFPPHRPPRSFSLRFSLFPCLPLSIFPSLPSVPICIYKRASFSLGFSSIPLFFSFLKAHPLKTARESGRAPQWVLTKPGC